MNATVTTPVPVPITPPVLSASQSLVGVPVTPLQRLRIMSPQDWEEFILEWADSIRSKYTDVHRCGGAGDLGRDIIGFKNGVNPQSAWDNYQCKHYGQPLAVADVVAEVGKLLYHASQGEFTLPDEYSFLAPHGPSTALIKVLQKETLKQELLDRWDKLCATSIKKDATITLASITPTIEAYNFASVRVIPPLCIIEGHQATKYYVFRFGGGLPSRTLPIPKPPATLLPNEHTYIKKLLDAYEDDRQTKFPTIDDVQANAPDLGKHLDRSREQFFSAEDLRTTTRDNIPPGTYEHLQTEIFDGIQDVYDNPKHTSGYERVKESVREARIIQITGNPLVGVMHTNDRAGICHQLANDDKLTWVHEKKTGKDA